MTSPTPDKSWDLSLFLVFLLFLFNQSYEIHLHALAMQDRGNFIQFKELLKKFKFLQVQVTGGRSF